MKVTYAYADRTVTVNTVSKSYQYEHKKTVITVLLDFYEAGLIYKLNIIDASGEKNESHVMTYAGTENGKHKYTSELWVENTTYAGEILMSMSIEENDNGEIVERWTGETFEKYINATPGPHNTDLDPTVDALVLDDIYAQLSAKLNITHKGYYNTVELGVVGTTLYSYVIAIHAALHARNFEGLARVRVNSVVSDVDFDEITVYINSDTLAPVALIDGFYNDQPYHYYTIFGDDKVQGWKRYLTSDDLTMINQNIALKIPLTYLDTDGTLVANSDEKIATQKATKTYADTKIPLTYLDADENLTANSDTKIATQKAVKTNVDAIKMRLNDVEDKVVTSIAFGYVQSSGVLNLVLTFDDNTTLSASENLPLEKILDVKNNPPYFDENTGELVLTFVGDIDDGTPGTQNTVRIPISAILSGHIAQTDNPHSVTKAQVGLGNVNNTSDLSKPISTAQQTEFDKKLDKDIRGYDTITPADADLIPIYDISGNIIGKMTATALASYVNAAVGSFVASGDYSASGLIAFASKVVIPTTPFTETSTYAERITAGNSNEIVQVGGKKAKLSKVQGYSAVVSNLVTNGDFSNGTTGWSGNDMQISNVNGKLQLKTPVSATPVEAIIAIPNGIPKNATDIFYIYAQPQKIYTTNFLEYRIRTYETSTTFVTSTTDGVIKGVVQSNSTNNLRLGLRFHYTTALPTDTILGTYDNVMVVNLSSMVALGLIATPTQSAYETWLEAQTTYKVGDYFQSINTSVIANELKSIGENKLKLVRNTATQDGITFDIENGVLLKGTATAQTDIVIGEMISDGSAYKVGGLATGVTLFAGTTQITTNTVVPSGTHVVKLRVASGTVLLTTLQPYIYYNAYALNVYKEYVEDSVVIPTNTLRHAHRDFAGYGLVNLMTNGGFDTNITGWTPFNVGTTTITNGIAIFTATATNGALRQNKVLTPNTKYYVSARYKANSSSVRLVSSDDTYYTTTIASHSGNGEFEIKSSIFTTPTTINNALTRFELRDARTSGWTEIQIDYYIVINLTELHRNGIIPTIPATAGEFEVMVIRDELDLESYNVIKRVDASNRILTASTATPFDPIDAEYVAYNYGTEVIDIDTVVKPTITTKYVRDVVTQADTNTEYIKELQDKVVELESAIKDISDDLTLEINAIKDELDNIELQLWSGSQTIAEMTPTYNFPMRRQYVSTKIKVTASIGANNITGIATLNGSGVGTVIPDLFPLTTYNVNSQSSQMTISHGLAGDVIVTKIELVDDLQTAVDEVVEIIDKLALGDTNTIEEVATNEGVLTPSVSKRVTIPVDPRTSFLIWTGTQQIDNADAWVDIAGTQYLIGLTRVRVELIINAGTYEAILTTEGTTAGVLDGDTFGDATNIRVNSSTHRIEMQVINEIGVTTLTQIRAFIHY